LDEINIINWWCEWCSGEHQLLSWRMKSNDWDSSLKIAIPILELVYERRVAGWELF